MSELDLPALKAKLQQEPGWSSVREALHLDALIEAAEEAERLREALEEIQGLDPIEWAGVACEIARAALERSK